MLRSLYERLIQSHVNSSKVIFFNYEINTNTGVDCNQ